MLKVLYEFVQKRERLVCPITCGCLAESAGDTSADKSLTPAISPTLSHVGIASCNTEDPTRAKQQPQHASRVG